MYPSYFDHQGRDLSEDKRRRIQEKVLVKHRYEQERQNSFEKNMVDSERRKGRRKSHGNDSQSLNFDFKESYQYESYRHHGTESARELHSFERMYDPGEEIRSQSSFDYIQPSRLQNSQTVYDPQADLYEKLSALKVPKINTKRVPGFSSYAQKFRQDSIMRSNNSSRSTMVTNSAITSTMSSRNNSGRSRELVSPSRISVRQREISLLSSSSRTLHSVDASNSGQGSLYGSMKMTEKFNEIPERNTPDIMHEEMQEMQRAKGALQAARDARGVIQVTLKSDQKIKDKPKPHITNRNGHKKSKKALPEQNTARENEVHVETPKEHFIQEEVSSVKHAQKIPRNNAQNQEHHRAQEFVNEPKVQYNQKKKLNKPETKVKPQIRSPNVPEETEKDPVRITPTAKEKGKTGEGSKPSVSNKDKLNKGQSIEKEIAKVQENYLAHRTATTKQKQQTDNSAASSNKTNASKSTKQLNTTDSKNNASKSLPNSEIKVDKTKTSEKSNEKKTNKEFSETKPKKGILRKTSSFKVIGNSDHYFGYMSISDGVAVEKKEVKRVRYHADHYPEVRPLSA